jgi:translation elongation factor P/translation initiation factor 5A
MRTGMVIVLENHPYRVVAADYHPGQGQMGGATHARLQSIDTGTFREHSFRGELRLQDLPVEKHPLEFLYLDGD